MPELAAGFLVGSLFSLFIGGLFTFLQLSKYKSTKYALLQKNLEKVGLRWNDLEGSIEKFSTESTIKINEIAKAQTTYIVFTLLAILLSWLGLLLLLLLWVSLKKLIRDRLEKELFASELTTHELNSELIRAKWPMLFE